MSDWDLVQKWAHIQCTQPEIATAVGVSVDTLHRHPEFAEVYKRRAEGGRKSLRRMQFESATAAPDEQVSTGDQTQECEVPVVPVATVGLSVTNSSPISSRAG